MPERQNARTLLPECQNAGNFADDPYTRRAGVRGRWRTYTIVGQASHWHVRGDANGRWAVTMRLALDTSLAESRSAEVAQGALAH